MEKKKENVIEDFYNMTLKSWTYGKMTKEERENWRATLGTETIKKAVKGSYNQRWEILQALYHSFLLALNYTWDWRESENVPF